MSAVLLRIDDLSDDSLERVLRRARSLCAAGRKADRGPGIHRVVGLAFFEGSLRTRVGFAVAAARLGWQSVDLHGPRAAPTSQPEPWTETLRVLSGMVDIVVARPGRPLDRESTLRWSACPVVNGGDAGATAEHPTQAVIDLFAMEHFVGPVGDLAVAVCGDLRMRAARSFLQLLARRPPRRLVVITDPLLCDEATIPALLQPIAEKRTLPDLDDVDVINVVGIPNGAIDGPERRRLQVDRATMDRLPPHAAVLSPMPVLDEVETAALDHPRIRYYEQSDIAVAVRMAILEEFVRGGALAGVLAS